MLSPVHPVWYVCEAQAIVNQDIDIGDVIHLKVVQNVLDGDPPAIGIGVSGARISMHDRHLQ